MFKKLIFIIPVAILTLSSAPLSAHACDYICPEGQETCESPCSDEPSIITGTIAEPTGDTAEILTTSEDAPAATPTDESQNNEVTPAEDAETAAPAEKGPFIATIEQFAEEQLNFTLDHETWPLVLSASALTLTVILIIIINLVARRKARKFAESDRHDLMDGVEGLRDL